MENRIPGAMAQAGNEIAPLAQQIEPNCRIANPRMPARVIGRTDKKANKSLCNAVSTERNPVLRLQLLKRDALAGSISSTAGK
jgi:hypothetical protein